MKKETTISLAKTPGFGKLLNAYLEGENPVLPSPVFDVKKAIEAKKNFQHRQILTQCLAEQNKDIFLSEKSSKNIELLGEKNAFCITTGHQLALAGGPLFVTYKILTTIKLASDAKKANPEYNFVPVFWLASEDHDKEEIDHFSLFGKTIKWETDQVGAVGSFSTKGIEEMLDKMATETNGLETSLVEKLKKAYSQKDLSSATRYLVNELFGEYGLVIIDGNDGILKDLFFPVMERELDPEEKITYHSVKTTNEKLINAGFEPAINPRELNLFLLSENKRDRLEFNFNMIETVEDSKTWTLPEFTDFAKKWSSRISPNVLLRPVYQETVLPNLAYVGGPAETEYWLQLDDLFKALNVPLPQRVLRICATVSSAKNLEKITEAGLTIEDIFGDEAALVKKITLLLGGDNLNFTNEKNSFDELFEKLALKAKAVDPTLEGAVNAEKARQEKALEGVFGRITKAEKTKQEGGINRMLKIRNSFLPYGKPQERTTTLLELKGDLNLIFDGILEADLNVMNVFTE
jgi:bacillithiol biosynthesis cysteine-adding enzyme BshC